MSIFIKGMEMPMSCESCQFRRCISNLIMFSWVGCQLDDGIAKKDSFKGRHPDCPLVEVKVPHGRLGDFDALKDEWKRCDGDNDYEKAWITTVRRSINAAPTVLEAEGKDDV